MRREWDTWGHELDRARPAADNGCANKEHAGT